MSRSLCFRMRAWTRASLTSSSPASVAWVIPYAVPSTATWPSAAFPSAATPPPWRSASAAPWPPTTSTSWSTTACWRPGTSGAAVARVLGLAARGYEPYQEPDGTIRLRNCPFDRIAAHHRDLVCGANHAMLQALVVL